MKDFRDLVTGDFVYKNGLEKIRVKCYCSGSVQLEFMQSSSDCIRCDEMQSLGYTTVGIDFNEEM